MTESEKGLDIDKDGEIDGFVHGDFLRKAYYALIKKKEQDK